MNDGMSVAEGERPLVPNPYCVSLPTQLRAWDSTSLRCFMECPRKYQLNIVEGWRSGSNLDLEFGSLWHESVELFDRLRAQGATKEQATLEAVKHCIQKTWIDDKPWSGVYSPVWRCNNWLPGKRNVFRCTAAKGWWAGTQERCPKCQHTVSNRNAWVPENKYKNRYTLLRSVLLYCDEQPEGEGGVKPIVFPDGQIALELSFQLELPWDSPDADDYDFRKNKPYLLCGHLDSMISVAGENMVRERKTTRSTISYSFFDRYAPDIQIDNYDLAGDLMFGETLHPHAVMVEVMQVGVEFSRMQRGLVNITEGRRAEHLRDLEYHIKEAERCARNGYYPKRTASCNNGGGCRYRRVCREEPGETRQRILETYYTQDHWNPLKER